MKKISRLALVVAIVLALAAPAIAASFATGKYSGTTAQVNKRTGKHRKISFHADSTAAQITNLKFVETGKCSDGGRSSGTQKGLHADVDANGDFQISAKSTSGATKLKLSGHIGGSKAKGTFSVKSRFNKDTNNPDPDGSIKCSTGTVKWSAKLQS
ncbi:MAG: hypothetical protein QOG41_1857 [Thermoleophilaceae bacterium]|jgi:hypothetical protein|nr:hypothetical protein [Thermoleophilaceae bacterium]